MQTTTFSVLWISFHGTCNSLQIIQRTVLQSRANQAPNRSKGRILTVPRIKG